jgi:hypothetical protein
MPAPPGSGGTAVADFTLVELSVWNGVLDTNARNAAEGYIATTYFLGGLLPQTSLYYPGASLCSHTSHD